MIQVYISFDICKCYFQIGWSMGEEGHHVHFGEEVEDGVNDNGIVVREKGKGRVEVQLGFLQIHHMYEVAVVLTRATMPKELGLYSQRDEPVPNINCRLKEVKEDGEQVRQWDVMVTLIQVKVLLTLKTVKEKLVREKLVLEGE